MKIKRYFGKDTQEAMMKVKMDLGNDAVILNTRKVKKKGIFNIFKKPMVEVLAAVDEYPNSGSHGKDMVGTKNLSAPETQVIRANGYTNEKIRNLENKIDSLEQMIKGIYESITTGNNTAEELPKKMEKDESHIFEVFYRNLVKNDVDPDFATRIINNLKSAYESGESVSDQVVKLYNLLAKLLDKPEVIQLKPDGKPTVVMFIGPTGVGKTTTLAKIAANYSLNFKKKVGLITTDTYRIAAVEQLKTYAEILGLPLSIVYSPNEIVDAIAQYSDKDIVLIDTAGRSHNNKAQMEEISAWIEASRADEVYLLVSMTTSNRNLRELVKNYSFLKNYKILLTKFDESPVVGMIINIRLLTGMKLSYITTGQNVPDDIEVADIDKILRTLLGSLTQ